MSVKAGCAELLYAYIDVEPVTFNRGFYTVDVRYFYRITADAFVGAARPVEISGLAVFDKRVILFGSEGSAKVFSSQGQEKAYDVQNLPTRSLPTAVVESVDPIILSMKLVDVCECRPCDCCCEIPPSICACFPEELVMGGDVHRLYVTLAVLHHPHGAGHPAAHPRLRLLPAGEGVRLPGRRVRRGPL